MAKILTSEYTLDLIAPQLENMTDDEFFSFCEQNKHLHIERDETHQIIFMPPVSTEYSALNFEINVELGIWNRKFKSGIAFESSSGFFLPDNSMKSPDCSWIGFEKWNALTDDRKKNFAHVSPDFVIELMSPSDNQKSARQKMEKWVENGVQLGWLIDPAAKEVFIYRADGTINKVQGFENKLSGENVLTGFELDLSLLK